MMIRDNLLLAVTYYKGVWLYQHDDTKLLSLNWQVHCDRAQRSEVAGVVGGSLAAVGCQLFCFTFSDLLLAFSACMLTTLCSLGCLVFHLQGFPIGGLLSKIAASIVLGTEEQRWICGARLRKSRGFAPTCYALRGRPCMGELCVLLALPDRGLSYHVCSVSFDAAPAWLDLQLSLHRLQRQQWWVR